MVLIRASISISENADGARQPSGVDKEEVAIHFLGAEDYLR
jgi:hypothetical protein